jgi:hypothetical protein
MCVAGHLDDRLRTTGSVRHLWKVPGVAAATKDVLFPRKLLPTWVYLSTTRRHRHHNDNQGALSQIANPRST